MTALCGGGTSGPIPGVAAVVDYSSGLIASILASRGLSWLIPVIPLAGLPPLILSSFCGSDPPAVPTFTSAETNAVLQLQFGADFDSGVAKLKDMLLYNIWWDACHCTSGTPITYPTITPPAGTPIFQPPVAPVAAPCMTQVHNLTAPLPINRSTIASLDTWLGLVPTVIRLKASTKTTAGAGRPVRVDWNILNQAQTSTLATYFVALGVNQTFQADVPVPSGGMWMQVFYNDDVTGGSGAGTGSGTTLLSATWEAYCGQVPGSLDKACCPPDQATQSYLDLILQTVTLIQRQAVPFAYVPGTAHAGLSGAGTIDISGLIGAKVAVTTIPTALGRVGSTPTEYFDMGFLTFGTPDGYPQSYKLERESQVMLPARCGAFTVLAYDLHPGVVVTITELVREP